MFLGLIVVKKLRTIALLLLDNTFNSVNFAFYIATLITHFFDLGGQNNSSTKQLVDTFFETTR